MKVTEMGDEIKKSQDEEEDGIEQEKPSSKEVKEQGETEEGNHSGHYKKAQEECAKELEEGE